jgi:short subunit dehydrogenase-like uncharacterized protein
MSEREYDLVLYGATGFVGRLTAHHLAASAPAGTRIALGGRSRARLESLRSELGPPADSWGLAVADSFDQAALEGLARSATAVATSVGPYARYGRLLVAACAQAGTHYADLTGEVLFVRESVESLHDLARRSGARIVHSCGYDSVPSDLGVWLLHEKAVAEEAGELTDTVLKAWMKGGLSGGTIDSARNQVDTVRHDAELRAVVADPYALSPQRGAEPNLREAPDMFFPSRDPLLGEWIAPFVMAPYNTRVVRRSNALNGWAYGRSLRYREVMAFGSRPVGAAMAVAATGAVVAMGVAVGFRPARPLLDRVLPAPGDGPSQQTMDRGRFRSEVHTLTSAGSQMHAVIASAGDPGYKATAVMFGESALALALDGETLPDRAGVLTPATGIGSVLTRRLRTAGFTVDTA